ncbi:MAG: DUF134 domain-containing protein [Dehalococcoidia bacterium]|nr:DUF134 domain-containing protein [Dehalococcoidia bacterium]
MGRRHIWRRVSWIPPATQFRPVDARAAQFEEVRLLVEEAEAIRLNDLEGLDQEECARRMNVSRSTFSRILDSARRKIADALLNGKGIRIEGGNYEMAARRFRCVSGHEWEVPFERLIVGPPEACPTCDTPSVMPLFPPGMGRRWQHRRGLYR